MKGLRQVQVRHGMEFFADEAMHDRELRLADVHGILEHRVEHGLKFAGRTADHFKNVGGGGLLLQRFTQLAEQPRILYGDDSLRGEVLDQLDLLVVESQHLLPVDGDGADQLVVLEHRH